MTSEESKQKYDAGHPKITVRVTPELKARLQAQAKAANKNLSELLLACASASPDGHPTVTRPSPDGAEVKARMTALLKFFQKNAPNLDITEQERQTIKDIIQWMKTL